MMRMHKYVYCVVDDDNHQPTTGDHSQYNIQTLIYKTREPTGEN